MMVASKVTISPETRAKMNNPALSPTKKRELRECLVKDRIRRAVGGECTKQELVAAAGYSPNAKSNDYANGITLINSMLKRGIISHNNSNKFRKQWYVTEDTKVKPTPKEVAATVMPPKVVVELQEYKLDKLTLKDMAKEFAWKQNSDSLREFISYVENAIK